MRKYVCRISVLEKEKVGEEWRCISAHALNSTARTLEWKSSRYAHCITIQTKKKLNAQGTLNVERGDAWENAI